MGALLFAREELSDELLRPPANGAAAPARDPARLLVITYGLGDPVKFRMDGEVVDLIPVRAAHTGQGTIINRSDIMPYRDMILGVQAKVQQMINQVKSEQEVLAARVTGPYDGSRRTAAGTHGN